MHLKLCRKHVAQANIIKHQVKDTWQLSNDHCDACNRLIEKQEEQQRRFEAGKVVEVNVAELKEKHD